MRKICWLLPWLLLQPSWAIGSDSGTAGAQENLLQPFWQAKGPRARQKAAKKILRANVAFETIWQALRRGRPYRADVEKGLFLKTRRGRKGVAFHYSLLVPEDYDPIRSYQVRVYLHGGVNRSAWPRDGSWWTVHDKLARPDRILVFPSSWREAMWWQESQVENLSAILDRVKRTYHVDENRVYLFGLSDGGTGAYFLVCREATPWAGVFPFIGHPAVLANPATGVQGSIFIPNLTNKPFFVVNGAHDHLYPIKSVRPFLDLFERAGMEVVFRPQPDGGHDVAFWPKEAAEIENFVSQHVRDPLPGKLFWETDRVDRYNRIHWLVITELGAVRGEGEVPDYNAIFLAKPGAALGLDFDEDDQAPARVRSVLGETPAAEADLRAGDLIVEINGRPTPQIRKLARVLIDTPPDSKLEILIKRADVRLSRTLRLPPDPPEGAVLQAFPRDRPSGRVLARRRGNHIHVQTRGVRRYKLLLSPDCFDFEQEITVQTNGLLSFSGRVDKDPATLLRWAASDHDPTMLFAAELDVEVPAVGSKP